MLDKHDLSFFYFKDFSRFFKMLKNSMTIVLPIVIIAILMLYSRMKENFEDDIDPNK